MSRDNWARLVDAVLKKDLERQLALAPSFDSTISDDFSSFCSIDSSADDFDCLFRSGVWKGDIVRRIIERQIQLADQVIKAADSAASFKQECSELKSKSDKLVGFLRQAARASSDLYERPTIRIIASTEHVLDKALTLILKCRNSGLIKKLFTIIPAAAFRKMSAQLENSIGDVSWLLRVSDPAGGDEYLGMPPIAANYPILGLIWEQIAILFNGLPEDRGDAAASLASLTRDNDRYGKLIIEEGGVGPLLRLLKEGKTEGQEHAARAIGLLGKDPESVDHMIVAGVCSVFMKVLKEGPMKVQAVVAWATSELVAHHRKCQDLFAQHNIIQLLVSHLAFKTETSNPPAKGYDDENSPIILSDEAREMEDPDTRDYMKEMAARALWHLAKGNSPVCQSITESRGLLCFAVLLEKGPERVQYNCAMALMEISAVAEENDELWRSAFTPCNAVVNQLFQVIEKADSEILLPCVKEIGILARTFRATETRMIGPLVKLLDEQEIEVSKEACVALTKFACSENYLHLDHSKAIVEAGGANNLVQLVYFGEHMLQNSALVLLSYIALHVPDSEELARDEVLTVLEWASKQAQLTQDAVDEEGKKLLKEAIRKLELYQSRGFV